MASVTVPSDHVGLVLLQNGNLSFYLDIPLSTINGLCLTPRKYLRFLGWCILGIEGVLALQAGGYGIGDNGDLTNRGIYHYVPTEELDFAGIVDLEVIKLRTNVPSETTQTRDNFRGRLLERDVRCVWTGVPPSLGGVGLHIIPYYKRGPEWLQLIIANRPKYGENVGTLNDINDIRNGVFANAFLHSPFDQRLVVVLKTPNVILEREDVPARHDRPIREDVTYPANSRYTLQWLSSTETEEALLIAPNNSDATFGRNTRQFKPSDLLLHYNYGAAAVKIWGRNTAVLDRLATPPRPAVPVSAEAGPSKGVHDRAIAIRKREDAKNRAGARARAGKGSELVESEGQATWDEDDVMLFFWGNTKAAQERHLKKANEDARRIEQWRGDVLEGSA